MIKQNKNIPSIRLIEKVKTLCDDSGEIRSENGQPFYGKINITFQKGKRIFVERSETMK